MSPLIAVAYRFVSLLLHRWHDVRFSFGPPRTFRACTSCPRTLAVTGFFHAPLSGPTHSYSFIQTKWPDNA